MMFVYVLILTNSVLPYKNVCLSNGSLRACSSINMPFSMNDWVLAFIGTIHDSFPFCRWTLQTTHYLCEHIVEWACKYIFFGLCNKLFSLCQQQTQILSSSEIIPLIREAPVCTRDKLMTLFLYRALHLSQITSSSCISQLISFETYFCNG